MRTCEDCGATSEQAVFPVRQIDGLPELCLDCALTWASRHAREARSPAAVSR